MTSPLCLPLWGHPHTTGMRLKVLFEDKDIFLSAPLQETVLGVKQKLHALEGLPLQALSSSRTALFWNGRELRNDMKLAEVGPLEELVLLLTVKPVVPEGAASLASAARARAAAGSKHAEAGGKEALKSSRYLLKPFGAVAWPESLTAALESVQKGYEEGLHPTLSEGGQGGTYFLSHIPPKPPRQPWEDEDAVGPPPKPVPLALFKPRDEER